MWNWSWESAISVDCRHTRFIECLDFKWNLRWCWRKRWPWQQLWLRDVHTVILFFIYFMLWNGEKKSWNIYSIMLYLVELISVLEFQSRKWVEGNIFKWVFPNFSKLVGFFCWFLQFCYIITGKMSQKYKLCIMRARATFLNVPLLSCASIVSLLVSNVHLLVTF